MCGRLLRAQKASARGGGCCSHVEEAPHILRIGNAASREDRQLTGEIDHLWQRALDRLDAEQVATGLEPLDHKTARGRSDCRALVRACRP